jgi:cytosine/uracil/thiamine/allantoin permease
LRAGDAVATVLRPAFSGTMRARQTKKEQRRVTTKQWVGYIVVAAATTWLTKTLDDLIDRRFGEPAPD